MTTKTSQVTAADASAQQLVSARLLGGTLKESVGTLEALNGDAIGKQYRMARVHSRDRISRVLLSCDAITSAAGDVGIYRAQDGAVVDADFFASAVSLASAQVHLDVTHEADPADAGAGYGHADVERPLWQALGLTSDPNAWYDIVVTLTAAATATGTLAMKVQYVSGN